MSKDARILVLAVVIAAGALEVVAYIVYRGSSDGQAGALFPFIALYAVLAIGGIRMVDRAVGRVRGWLQRV